jgi:hypothetical protein
MPPPGSVVVCRDEMGPESAKSFPGRELVPVQEPVATALLEPSPTAPLASTSDVTMPALASSAPARPVGRAIQELDYGRRGKGYLFGAFKPADGEALTAPSEGRTTANDVDFLEQVEAWIAPDIERI